MNPNNKIISCIIPAYNEADNIGKVLKVVEGHPLIKEVVVVNDGSTDNTSEVVKKYSFVKLIELKDNSGKAYAVKKGVEASSSDIIMLLDADLLNLTPRNITELAMPVIDGNAEVTISLRKYSPLNDWFMRLINIDIIAGERCFRKKNINALKISENTGYGMEALMNEYIIHNNLIFFVVNFRNVSYVLKSTKIGFWKGILEELSMYKNILKNVPLHKFLLQFVKMLGRKKFDKLYKN